MCELPAAWHQGIHEPSDTSETVSPRYAFEHCLSVTKFPFAESYLPINMQVHNKVSSVARVKVTASDSFRAGKMTSGQIDNRNIGIKNRCYLFVYRWMHRMIAWLVFHNLVSEKCSTRKLD